MEDIGGKEKPPGDPPDVPGSWVRKVVGSSEGGMPVPEEVVDERFVESRLSLEFPNGEDGEPVITIGEEVLTAMNSLWKRCMIVRVLGRNVPILSLRRKLIELWKPKGSMFVMDLPRHYFMVRFELEEEYMAALSGGPWRAFGSYLMVQAWSPEFDPLKDEIVTTPVWVRLSHIPVNFYHKTILMGIAKGLGRPIKVDLTTLKFERARYARICVEVNLNKPLKGSVMVNGERYYVSYEGISAICSMCGMFGHLVHACPKNVTERALAPVPSPTMTHAGPESMGRETEFTQVRQVRRKPEQSRTVGGSMRRQEERSVGGRRTREVRKEGVLEELSVSNRFGGLEDEGEKEELAEVGVRKEGNKENENTENLNWEGPSRVHGKTMTFVANEKEENQASIRLGPKVRKASNMRSTQSQKPKSKLIGPTRGLVYGPTTEGIDMSASGKRLRVEKESIGRPGGVFTGVSDVEGKERSPDHAEEQRSMQVQIAQMETPQIATSDSCVEQVGEALTGTEA
ncbi:uncharacterized protein LOC125608229 [Brassica napus]|uniref:uncharacterized protein LOC125608229 n=1 Tax=Brassica napus TaxID=3708 RepID=UPI002078D16B|nr:uncharacterized protein LOC125608229 [Brassica napus]